MRRVARPLLYLGAFGIVFGLAKLHAAEVGEYDFTGSSRFAWTVAYACTLALTSYGVGLPDLPRSAQQAIVSAAAAATAAAGAMSLLQLVTGDALLPRFVVFGSAILLIPWTVVCATVARGGHVRAEFRDRVVVVAGHAEVELLKEHLARRPERPALLVDALEPTDAVSNAPRSRPLVERAIAAGATLVVLDRGALNVDAIVHQAASLHEHGIRVRTLSLFYDQWLGKLPVSELERISLLFDIREIHHPQYLRTKRVLDLLLSLIGCAVFATVLPAVAVGNVIGNRGPLLYRQERVGKNGRIFTILKFRTMRPASGDLSGWTTVDDPRVTAFGGVLRRSHLDELPQVVNVLRGDLTIVGPRPEQPRYVGELRAKLPFYDLRHLVRPGLTGWAQVKYGYAGDDRDALEKLQYEFWYLRHQSLLLDARIVGRTLRAVLGQEGVGR